MIGAAAVWLLALAADGVCAHYGWWPAVVALSVLLIAAVIVAVGNIIADRFEALDQPSTIAPVEARYTGDRHAA